MFPSPFILAILLSILTLVLALLNTRGEIEVLAKNWQEGLWSSSLL
ncbi:TIGR00366 family protein, partial [bacterium]|nr:TIGR00366 family protein [bacterium]